MPQSRLQGLIREIDSVLPPEQRKRKREELPPLPELIREIDSVLEDHKRREQERVEETLRVSRELHLRCSSIPTVAERKVARELSALLD